jgi:hypothetical protein
LNKSKLEICDKSTSGLSYIDLFIHIN